MVERKTHYRYPIGEFDLRQVKEGDLLALNKKWKPDLIVEVSQEESKLVTLSRTYVRENAFGKIVPQIFERTYALMEKRFSWDPWITSISGPCSKEYEEKNRILEEAEL